MWPFKCKDCDYFKEQSQKWFKHSQDELKEYVKLVQLGHIHWTSLDCGLPPINTNLLVANIDFTYFGFLYYEDGWDYSRKINMQDKGQVWATYTNAESIHWWLNLDLIKKS